MTKDDKLILEPANEHKKLSDLLANFEGEYMPAEFDWGEPVGHEYKVKNRRSVLYRAAIFIRLFQKKKRGLKYRLLIMILALNYKNCFIVKLFVYQPVLLVNSTAPISC